MLSINPYLNFQGNTEVAFNFYQSVFGGEFIGGISRFRDSPGAGELPEDELDKVMHIALPVGGGNMLMGTDFLESMDQKIKPGNNITIAIHPDSRDEADRIYNALSAGGEVLAPMKDEFWGAYFGMFIDKFGIQWMINYRDPDSE